MFLNRLGVVARTATLGFLLAVLATTVSTTVRAASCPKPGDDIATDRPDVTNSSIVVPVGSLQNENGVNLTGRDGGRSIDGSNSRWRLGIAPCLEILIDLPSHVGNVKSPGASGFSDVAPAIKWQMSPVPGKIDLAVTAGVALPTGAVAIAGRGAQPYIQLPWSWELHDGWGVSGMFTEFFRPDELEGRHISEATFVIEKKLTERVSVFTEYVGDYPDGARPTQSINSGGLYRITPTQQVDFHVAFGLNRNSPDYVVGIGYSFRVDGLFR
ncbi:transporter [Bradyrhizobium tropiciagri]|uniref:transporter n=1 Tax=Bradyrhizobium tropiciagri TaxID=312253 RepID=UPI001BA78386|nr:transporter [Bradyrhizobium tropiciagri]